MSDQIPIQLLREAVVAREDGDGLALVEAVEASEAWRQKFIQNIQHGAEFAFAQCRPEAEAMHAALARFDFGEA